MSKGVKEVLLGAAALIEQPGCWTQGAFARDAAGRNVSVFADDAQCWCIAGAVMKCWGPGGQLSRAIKLDELSELFPHAQRRRMRGEAAGSGGGLPMSVHIILVSDFGAPPRLFVLEERSIPPSDVVYDGRLWRPDMSAPWAMPKADEPLTQRYRLSTGCACLDGRSFEELKEEQAA